MKRVKLLARILSIILLCAGVLCGCEKDMGTLYTLEEVYAVQEIGKDDLLNIAYHNGDAERNKTALEGFEPKPIGELSEEISLKIRECVAEDYRNDGTFPEATAENITIEKYLGCYNRYYAIRFTNSLSNWPGVDIDPETRIQEVGGIKFCYIYTSFIFLWKGNP